MKGDRDVGQNRDRLLDKYDIDLINGFNTLSDYSMLQKLFVLLYSVLVRRL